MRSLALTGLVCALAGLSPAAAKDAPATQPADVATAVEGINAFAADLYSRLAADEKGNIFFSPASIDTALAMTYAGARGQTARQMAATLHYTLGQDRLHEAMGVLVRQLNAEGKDRGYKLAVANALWGAKGYTFKKDFLDLVAAHYEAELSEMNFSDYPENVRKFINNWVEKRTNDKIKDLIPQGILDKDTRLVLTNAVYFKGDWALKFKPESTKEAPFKLRGEKTVDVPMMHKSEDVPCFAGDGFALAQLPYKNDELSMVILLPEKVDGLAKLEKDLTARDLAGWIAKARKTEVALTIPKFRMTCEFPLAKALMSMGMKDAFSDIADFSGMTEHESLFISAVLHKAYVDVNEEGTEAAGATAVVMKPTAIRMPTQFVADHPFLFLIRDNATGAILFMGRMMNPKGE
ncbi:MAG: serpin family protein [Phycisphaerae bacterium]